MRSCWGWQGPASVPQAGREGGVTSGKDPREAVVLGEPGVRRQCRARIVSVLLQTTTIAAKGASCSLYHTLGADEGRVWCTAFGVSSFLLRCSLQREEVSTMGMYAFEESRSTPDNYSLK